MNEDMLVGEGRDVAGKIQETVGDVAGDPALQLKGLGKQVSGKAQKIGGAVQEVAENNAASMLAQLRRAAGPVALIAISALFGASLVSLFRRKG
ncbi:MAG: CsbD family protein [Pseudomonadota bacterium]